VAVNSSNETRRGRRRPPARTAVSRDQGASGPGP
jgi:hypothetical protein